MNQIDFIKAGQSITGLRYGYQKMFAFILGISFYSVSSYATGRRKVPLPVQKLIEELLKNEKNTI